MSADRESIARKIRALKAMRVENGCTEAEALTAAKLLADLLEHYNMTLDEAEIRESPFSQQKARAREDMVGAKLYVVANGIETLTGARYWTKTVDGIVEIHFFGFAHEVEIAGYLLAICAGAMHRAAREVNAANALYRPTIRHQKTASFISGMAERLRRRLIAMKPKDPTGTGLVVLKKDLIDQGLKDIGIELESTAQHRSRIDAEAYAAGQRAGDRVSLNAGITTGSNPQGLLT